MEPGVIAARVPVDGGAPAVTPVVPLPSDRVQIERRNGLDLAPDDLAIFESILATRPEVGVFMSRAWLSGFFDEPPAGSELSLLLFRDGAALCGFVPIAVQTARGHARISLLGGGAGSDRVDVMARPGAEVACADVLLKWLCDTFGQHGFVLELRDVPADSPLWGAAHRAGLRGDVHVTLAVHDIQPQPWLNIAAHGAGAPSPDPLDKHRRWLAKRGAVWTDLLNDPEEALAALDTLVAFLRGRWAGQGGSALDNPVRQRFHKHVIPRLLDESRLRMIRLAADGRAVGIFYGLSVGRWWGYYLAGYDRDWAGRIHLGRLMLATAIEQACSHGATEFDFLKGAEAVKYLWPVDERTTLDAEIASDHASAQLTRAVHSARDTAAAIAKSARAWSHRR
jgi:CelD/BcsL family acetyltransferase involved in cellulose biosynthesis